MSVNTIPDRQMTVAFLLVIHNKPEQVNLFIRQLLQYEKCYIYIHVDAKAVDIIPQLSLSDRVEVLPEHMDVKWGDYTQIKVNNYLLDYAKKTRHHDYYSLHSGADLLIRPVCEFILFLDDTRQYGYYECSRLPSGWQFGGGLGRLALKWPYIFRRRLSRYSPLRYMRSIYGKLYGAGLIRGKKLPEKYQYYGGADWFTISEVCVIELLEFIKEQDEFEDLFVDSLSGAEIYYVSIFQMLKGNRSVYDTNALRYIDWKDRGQILPVGSPNVCRMEFLDEIEKSGKFFARKFDEDIDAEIIWYFLKKCCKKNKIN